MTDKRIVLTTCGSQEEADRIAQYLVENLLAACVNIVPEIKSIYRWQNKVESAGEWLLIVKTLPSGLAGRIVLITVDDGSTSYLQWIDDSVK